jgi:hypothetical protein
MDAMSWWYRAPNKRFPPTRSLQPARVDRALDATKLRLALESCSLLIMSGNGTKRKKAGGQDEMTGREKKKVRLAEARSIPVQTPGPSTPAMAGPSKVVPTKNSEFLRVSGIMIY